MDGKLVITEQNERIARAVWYQYYRHKEVDQRVEKFLSCPSEQGPWLRRAREAQFLTLAQVAQKLKISKQTLKEMEAREEGGSITLKTLRGAAEAMNCELIYVVRPKERRLFSERLWKSLRPPAEERLQIMPHATHMRGHALGALGRDYMWSPKFRRKHNWTRNLNTTYPVANWGDE